jgi:hypothetical protein
MSAPAMLALGLLAYLVIIGAVAYVTGAPA